MQLAKCGRFRGVTDVRQKRAAYTGPAVDPGRPGFRELVRQWKEAPMFLSSIHEMVSHPAYLQIIGMDKEALPLHLDELRREPDH